MGSRLFSSVVRYLTLSFASLAASVTRVSIAFQFRWALLRPAIVTPMTSLHSWTMSRKLINIRLMLRQLVRFIIFILHANRKQFVAELLADRLLKVKVVLLT